jgi:PLD-like domain
MTQHHFKNLKSVLIEELNKAQASIYVAVAWFTDQDVLNLLTEKRKAGRKVVLVISNDSKNFEESYSLNFEPFKAVGGKLFVLEKAFLHHKFSIIDEQTLVNGSANYTYSGFHKNKENIMVLHDYSSASQFLEQFNELTEYYQFETGMAVSDYALKLKQEIKFAFGQIDFLEQELAQAEKSIEIYETKYRIRFRAIILEILQLQEAVLAKKAILTDKQEDKQRLETNRQTFQQLSNTSQQDAEVQKAIENKAQQKTIKELFREAVKLCHPDNAFISEALKERAQKIFIQLKEAFNNNDLATIQTILNELKNGIALGNTAYDTLPKEDLEQLLENLKIKIKSLYDKLTSYQSDIRYVFSMDNEAMNLHFATEEIKLQEQMRMLKNV